MGDGRRSRSADGLAGLLVVAGIAHFVVPQFFDRIVPRIIPGPARGWTLVSGVAELGCAAAVASPRHRRTGALLAAILFVVVFPANVQMAFDARHDSGFERFVAYARLPLQVPLVVWALRVVRSSAPARLDRTPG
jgi:uncharacterized membrane protein